MAETPAPPPVDEPIRVRKSGLIAAGLMFFGGMLAVVGICWAVQRYYELTRAPQVDVGALLTTTAILAAALGGGLLLVGASAALQRLESVAEASQNAEKSAASNSAAPPARSPAPESTSRSAMPARNADQDRLLGELVALTREVRDIMLLSDEERSKRLEIQAQIQAHRLSEEVPELLREHNWFEASKRVQSARERFPTLTVWTEMEEQIAAVRSQVEARDIESATRQVDELAALGAWERAEEVASDLLERHPQAAGARTLAKAVRKQRNSAEADTRRKLMSAAQEHTTRREWSEALAAAKSLIQRFPKSPEAEALRQQLPTLEANSEIKVRQKMEAEYRDLLNRRRFDEALSLAHALIERYPNSKQAEVLREQIPRLEEKAEQAAYP